MMRPLNPQIDVPRMAEILNAYSPGSITVETLAERERKPIAAGVTLERHAAVAPDDGRLIGWNVACSTPQAGPGRFLIRVFVDPAFSRQGVGSALFEDAVAFARQQRAVRLDHDMPDNRPEALRFAEHRGFVIDRHLCSAVLDLSSFDEAPFAGALEAAEASGIRFATLAELDNDVHRLWALENALNADIPGYETQGKEIPFAEYKHFVLDQPWFKPELQTVALEGDRWIGMATLKPQGDSFYHNLTGVVRSHRGRGLGLALKLIAIRTARQHGARQMETENDSLNAPMLALNRRLGYQPQPGRYLLIRTL